MDLVLLGPLLTGPGVLTPDLIEAVVPPTGPAVVVVLQRIAFGVILVPDPGRFLLNEQRLRAFQVSLCFSNCTRKITRRVEIIFRVSSSTPDIIPAEKLNVGHSFESWELCISYASSFHRYSCIADRIDRSSE